MKEDEEMRSVRVTFFPAPSFELKGFSSLVSGPAAFLKFFSQGTALPLLEVQEVRLVL